MLLKAAFALAWAAVAWTVWGAWRAPRSWTRTDSEAAMPLLMAALLLTVAVGAGL